MQECLLKKVEQKEQAAKAFGFYWETIDQLIEQIRSECIEIEQAFMSQDRVHLQEEIGDLILASASLAIFCDLDPHQTLKNSLIKFDNRFQALKDCALQDGYTDLKNQPFEVLMKYWKMAKKKTEVKTLG